MDQNIQVVKREAARLKRESVGMKSEHRGVGEFDEDWTEDSDWENHGGSSSSAGGEQQKKSFVKRFS